MTVDNVCKELDRERGYVEVDSERLAKCGYRLYPRIDGHEFRVFIHKTCDLEQSLLTGRGFLAQHGLKTSDGRGILSQHVDLIKTARLGGEKIMTTVYDPSVGHYPMIVLIESKHEEPVK